MWASKVYSRAVELRDFFRARFSYPGHGWKAGFKRSAGFAPPIWLQIPGHTPERMPSLKSIDRVEAVARSLGWNPKQSTHLYDERILASPRFRKIADKAKHCILHDPLKTLTVSVVLDILSHQFTHYPRRQPALAVLAQGPDSDNPRTLNPLALSENFTLCDQVLDAVLQVSLVQALPPGARQAGPSPGGDPTPAHPLDGPSAVCSGDREANPDSNSHDSQVSENLTLPSKEPKDAGYYLGLRDGNLVGRCAHCDRYTVLYHLSPIPPHLSPRTRFRLIRDCILSLWSDRTTHLSQRETIISRLQRLTEGILRRHEDSRRLADGQL